jgi:hypothetical protein
MKATLVSIQSINIILPVEAQLNIQQYYDCLITMTDLVMHLHDLGWFVVRVHTDSITLQRDFGTDGSEVLLNITIEV